MLLQLCDSIDVEVVPNHHIEHAMVRIAICGLRWRKFKVVALHVRQELFDISSLELRLGNVLETRSFDNLVDGCDQFVYVPSTIADPAVFECAVTPL